MNHPNYLSAAGLRGLDAPASCEQRRPGVAAGRLRAVLFAGTCTVLAAHAAHGMEPARQRAVPDFVAAPVAIGPTVTAVMRLPAQAARAAARAPFGTPVGAAGLASLRGGTLTPSSDMTLHGTVGQNVASNVVTGANIVSDGAFSNASGLPMVIQNSGANVLIQNATIVNVQFQ